MSLPSKLQNVCLYLSRLTSEVPIPTICSEKEKNSHQETTMQRYSAFRQELKGVGVWRLSVTMSVPYTGEVILISQKCCPSASSLEPRMAAVPQLYSEWKLTFRLSQVSSVAVDRLLPSQTQSNSGESSTISSTSSLHRGQLKW